jgi:eukaryotic-like serine/threonine-protein kinase
VKDPCPSSGVWQSLLNGTLEEEQSGWLAEHLDTCAGCRELLDRLAGQGTTTLAFAEELPASSQSSAELARLLAELKGQAPGVDVARWDIRPFLKPATRPGALGWFAGCEVLGIIAHGGMGIVLEARDPALDRVVAIKVLAPAVAGRESHRQRSGMGTPARRRRVKQFHTK